MRRHRRHSIVTAGAVLAFAGTFTVAAAALTPSDPLATHPAYEALNLPAAWDVTTGSPDVVIAIVDSGVEATHPDLTGAVRPGYDFVARADGAAPVDAHGTGVAAAAAARAENGIGGVGACFRCTLLPLQVVGPDGIALNVHIAEAIDYAVDHRVAVVNISLIGPNSPPELERAISRARAAGILVVAAAGNEGTDVPGFPAATPGAISVAASTYDGRRAAFSNYGTWVKFAAPECAPIAVLGGGSGVGCGTSMSSPLVAGVIALMRTQARYATPNEIESSLARASRFVRDTRYGVPDAAAALRDVGSPQPRLRPVVLGQAAVGHRLEAFSGLWVGSGADVAYQWERCRANECTAIAGATASTYVPVAADAGRRMRVAVTAAQIGTNPSPATRAVESIPRPLERPSIAGTAKVGRRLAARTGRWTGENLRFTITWQRCDPSCTDVGTGPVRRVREKDRGLRLRVRIVATNSVGTRSAVSERTRVVR
jgi:hypothetical protein